MYSAIACASAVVTVRFSRSPRTRRPERHAARKDVVERGRSRCTKRSCHRASGEIRMSTQIGGRRPRTLLVNADGSSPRIVTTKAVHSLMQDAWRDWWRGRGLESSRRGRPWLGLVGSERRLGEMGGFVGLRWGSRQALNFVVRYSHGGKWHADASPRAAIAQRCRVASNAPLKAATSR